MEHKKRRGIHVTMFSAIVLVIVVGAIFGIKGKSENPLFDKGTMITLYAHTAVGVKPELDLREFLQGEDLDYTKMTVGLEACDWNREGSYMVPIYYEGKETNCVIEIVVGEERVVPPSMNEQENSRLINPAE